MLPTLKQKCSKFEENKSKNRRYDNIKIEIPLYMSYPLKLHQKPARREYKSQKCKGTKNECFI